MGCACRANHCARDQPRRYSESSMSELVQMGYLSRLEAVDVIARSLVAGMPDRPQVTKLREGGLEVADGVAIDAANAELWRGVDRGKIEVSACGANGQRFRMD